MSRSSQRDRVWSTSTWMVSPDAALRAVSSFARYSARRYVFQLAAGGAPHRVQQPPLRVHHPLVPKGLGAFGVAIGRAGGPRAERRTELADHGSFEQRRSPRVVAAHALIVLRLALVVPVDAALPAPVFAPPRLSPRHAHHLVAAVAALDQPGQQERLRLRHAPERPARLGHLAGLAKQVVRNYRFVRPRAAHAEPCVGAGVHRVAEDVPDSDHVPVGAAPRHDSALVQVLHDQAEAHPVARVQSEDQLDDPGLLGHYVESALRPDAVAVGRLSQGLALERPLPHRLLYPPAARPRDALHAQRLERVLQQIRELLIEAPDDGACLLELDQSSRHRLQVAAQVARARDRHQELAARVAHVLDHPAVLGGLPGSRLLDGCEGGHRLVEVEVAEVFELAPELRKGVAVTGARMEEADGAHRWIRTGRVFAYSCCISRASATRGPAGAPSSTAPACSPGTYRARSWRRGCRWCSCATTRRGR